MKQWVKISPKALVKLIGFIYLFGMAGYASAESDSFRRYNEARNLDLKIRQQQTLRQQSQSSSKGQLEKRFGRQRSQQDNLQSQQVRQVPRSGFPSQDSTRRSSIERFKRQQRNQELGFKAETSQSVDRPKLSEQNPPPGLRQFFREP